MWSLLHSCLKDNPTLVRTWDIAVSLKSCNCCSISVSLTIRSTTYSFRRLILYKKINIVSYFPKVSVTVKSDLQIYPETVALVLMGWNVTLLEISTVKIRSTVRVQIELDSLYSVNYPNSRKKNSSVANTSPRDSNWNHKLWWDVHV